MSPPDAGDTLIRLADAMRKRGRTLEPTIEARGLAIRMARLASEHRAQEVAVLDLRGLSPVTDYFVICSGTSDRQMRAVFDVLTVEGRKTGWEPFGSAGYESATWMLLDLINLGISMGLQMLVMGLIQDSDAPIINSVRKLGFSEAAVLEGHLLDQQNKRHNLVIMRKGLALHWPSETA